MPTKKHPRRGSMQFWPRKRSSYSLARIRSWAQNNTAKPLGFIGYKAGMAHVMAMDNRPKSLTKGEVVSLPVTIVECPQMSVAGIVFYKHSLLDKKKITSILAPKQQKELAKKFSLPKKVAKNIEDVKEFDDLRLLVHSNPKKTGINTKKPKLMEIALGGSKEEKLAYAKEVLGKGVEVKDIIEEGSLVDVHGISKGKGFQGTVKRYGVPIKQKKGEKTKRGIGNLGAWTPKRVDYRVPQTGKMGYHLRTEYGKQVLKLSDDVKQVSKKGGITKYGVVKNPFVLVHGSIIGPRKRAVVLTQATRTNKVKPKDSFTIKQVVQ